ncbi:hypothetical protein ACWDUL_40155, partial [Nocardia niigatensis]
MHMPNFVGFSASSTAPPRRPHLAAVRFGDRPVVELVDAVLPHGNRPTDLLGGPRSAPASPRLVGVAGVDVVVVTHPVMVRRNRS